MVKSDRSRGKPGDVIIRELAVMASRALLSRKARNVEETRREVVFRNMQLGADI